MSKTQFVEYRDEGFWAYSVGLGIFLKHLIDVAEKCEREPSGAWLELAASWWRVVACVPDYGLHVDTTWNPEQIGTFIGLADAACRLLVLRESISADEMQAWDILDGAGVFARGAPAFRTAPVVELGRAIIELVNGSLPESPPGTWWLYGTEDGRDVIKKRAGV